LNEYFLLFRIFEQLALALKSRVALEYFIVLKYILLFRIFDELAVALKTEFALKIFKPGGRPPSPTPRLVRLWLVHNHNVTRECNTSISFHSTSGSYDMDISVWKQHEILEIMVMINGLENCAISR